MIAPLTHCAKCAGTMSIDGAMCCDCRGTGYADPDKALKHLERIAAAAINFVVHYEEGKSCRKPYSDLAAVVGAGV